MAVKRAVKKAPPKGKGPVKVVPGRATPPTGMPPRGMPPTGMPPTAAQPGTPTTPAQGFGARMAALRAAMLKKKGK
jgi:hypothetical protein